MITNIFFDIDGTLIDEDSILQAQLNAVAEFFGSSREEQERVLQEFFLVNSEEAKKKRQGIGHRKNDLQFYFSQIAQRVNKDFADEELETIAAHWEAAFQTARKQVRLFRNVPETLQSLTEAGYTLYAASGGKRKDKESQLQLHGIREHFTQVFTSDTLGSQKQHETFWKTVFEEIHVSPEECLVVGNQINDDIFWPQKLGAKTCLVQQPDAFRKVELQETVEPDYTVVQMSELFEIISLPKPNELM